MSVLAAVLPVAERPPAALEINDLAVGYGRGPVVLRHFDLRVDPGSICMILGPSGSGKSTLLKTIKGLLPAQGGTLEVFGQPAAAGDRRARRELQRTIAWIPQNLGLVRNASVLDNVLTGALSRVGTLASLAGVFPSSVRAQALAMLESLGIGAKAADRVYSLSGGERQRVAVARALMQEPQLVLADEFVSHLDPITTRETMDIVAGIARTGVAFLITSHEVQLVAEYGDRVVFIREGQKVHDGAAAAFTFASIGHLMAR